MMESLYDLLCVLWDKLWWEDIVEWLSALAIACVLKTQMATTKQTEQRTKKGGGVGK